MKINASGEICESDAWTLWGYSIHYSNESCLRLCFMPGFMCLCEDSYSYYSPVPPSFKVCSQVLTSRFLPPSLTLWCSTASALACHSAFIRFTPANTCSSHKESANPVCHPGLFVRIKALLDWTLVINVQQKEQRSSFCLIEFKMCDVAFRHFLLRMMGLICGWGLESFWIIMISISFTSLFYSVYEAAVWNKDIKYSWRTTSSAVYFIFTSFAPKSAPWRLNWIIWCNFLQNTTRNTSTFTF